MLTITRAAAQCKGLRTEDCGLSKKAKDAFVFCPDLSPQSSALEPLQAYPKYPNFSTWSSRMIKMNTISHTNRNNAVRNMKITTTLVEPIRSRRPVQLTFLLSLSVAARQPT